MHAILVLVRKSTLMFLHNKAAVVITFIVPIMIIYLVGLVYGLNRTDNRGPTGIRLAIVDEAHTSATQALVNALKNEKTFHVIDASTDKNGSSHPLTEAEARAALATNEYNYALVLPSDMISTDHFGIRIKYLVDARNDVESQMVTGILQKTIFTQVPQLLGQSLVSGAENFFGKDRWTEFNHTIAHSAARNFGGNEQEIEKRLNTGNYFSDGFFSKSPSSVPLDPSLRRLDAPAATPVPGTIAASSDDADSFISRIFKIETEQVAGKQATNPMASRLVGGYAIFFLLFAVSGAATSLFEEKQLGIFQRILSTSVRRSHILWSRFIFGTLLGVTQIGLMFLAGNLMYGLDILQHAIPLLTIAITAAAACTSFGLVVAAVSPTPEAASGLSTLFIMAMGSIGGAWFPVTFLPEFIQRFSRLSIVYWSTEGFTDVLWANQNFVQILPIAGILAGIAAGVLAIAVWLFYRGPMFD